MTEIQQNPSEFLAGLNILVVEDETAIAMMLEDMLIDFGCSVALAPNIDKALGAIQARGFDGVLLDMNIHGRLTTPVAEELIKRSVPFLLVTGYGAGGNEAPAIRSAPRLQKPFTLKDLAQRMTDVFVKPAAE